MKDEMPSHSSKRWVRLIVSCMVMSWVAVVGARDDDMVELAQKPAVEPSPSWAAKVDAEPAAPKNAQLEYLLIDRQLRVEATGSSLYSHFVMHLGNQSAVDSESHVQMTYRPSDQRITLHRLQLRRGDQTIDQLKRARISTLRRELDLEQGIIDGVLTTSIVLEDVRVGDILEYSYTLATGEDGLGTPFAETFTTQWSDPVRHSYLRVLHPSARKIAVRNTNESGQPVDRIDGAWREQIWQWRGLTSIPREGERPGWYIHYPYIQLSEAPSWQAVAHWAQRLQPPVPLSAELRSLVAQLKAPGATKAEQIINALRFVQDEIRYTGIEIGPGAYRAQPPDAVLKRRFGDCKEKSYLLVTLLKAFDVDARPALVNTYRDQGTRQVLPTAAAFNHMIVRVEHDGKVYWLDPTDSLQGGTLSTVQQAHFGVGLVVDDKGELETMPPAVLHAPEEVITEKFDLTAGVFETAKMSVESVYLGSEADRMRRYFAESSQEEITRQYLNFYKEKHPNISVSAPYNVADDRQANRLVVTESYALAPAFVKGNSGDRHFLETTAHVVQTAARAPKTIVRTSPLQLNHPTHVRYKAVFLVPERWSIEPLDKTIAGPGFTYKSTVRYQRNTVTSEYMFRTLADNIPAADVPEHARKLEAVRDDAYYYLSHAAPGAPAATSEPAPFKFNVPMLIAVIGGVVGGALMIRWMHRYENSRFPKPASADAPQGLSGWMILPVLTTIITPITLAYALFAWRVGFDANVWANLGSEQDPVVAHWGKIGLFVFVLSGYTLLLASTYLNYQLFTKQRAFPSCFIALLWFGMLWGLVTQGSLSALGLDEGSNRMRIAELVRDFLGSVLWTAYMLKSERVRATFVRTRAIAQPAPNFEQPLSAET